MIKGIYIENFKGIGEPGIKLELAPVTLLFGGNGAGKSTVLHAILFAYEVLVKANRNPDGTELAGKSVDLGGFHRFIHRQEMDRSVWIEFDLDMRSVTLDQEARVEEFMIPGEQPVDVSTIGEDVWDGKVGFRMSWNPDTAEPYVSEYRVTLNDEWLGSVTSNPQLSSVPNEMQVNTRHPLFRQPLAERDPEDPAPFLGVLDAIQPSLRTPLEYMFFNSDDVLGSPPADEQPMYVDPTTVPPNDQIVEWRRYTYVDAAEDWDEVTFVLYRDRDDHIGIWDVRLDIGGESTPGSAKRTGEPEASAAREHATPASLGARGARSRAMQSNLGARAAKNRVIAAGWIERLTGPHGAVVVNDWLDAMPNWEDELSLEIFTPTDLEQTSSPNNDFREDLDKAEQVFHQLMERLLIAPGRVLARALKDFRHIGPLRDIPPRSFRSTLTPAPARWSCGLAAWDMLSNADDELIEKVSTWLSAEDRLGTGYSLVRKRFKELEPDGWIMRILEQENPLDDLPLALEGLKQISVQNRVTLKDEGAQVELTPSDVAVGITQLVPVVVAALDGHRGITMIEQPEIHNHPAVEVGLGDLFIDTIHRGHSRFILETHGEHLMLRMLRRIRETTEDELPEGGKGLLPEELAVYFIERTNEGVSAKLLRIDETGEFIDRWPNGFFRERGKELF